MTIVFCLPGRSFSGLFLIHWTNLIQWCATNNITVALAQDYSPVVSFSRNKCLRGDILRGKNQLPFQGGKYDYIMWIDSDVLFSSRNLQKLLNANKDIVSGLYMCEDGKHFPTVKKLDFNYIKENGRAQYMTPESVKKEKGLFEVNYTGMGCMLVKRGVFEKLPYPWFYNKKIKITEGIEDYTSEDVQFCLDIREKGYKIWVDPSVICCHEKMKLVYPE